MVLQLSKVRDRKPIGAQGFTMIEIVVVIAVLSILATVLYNNLQGRDLFARASTTYVQILKVIEHVKTWKIRTGKTDYSTLTSTSSITDEGIGSSLDFTSPFGTGITVSAIESFKIRISVELPRSKVCDMLVERFKSAGYGDSFCSSGVIFNLDVVMN